MSIFLSLSQVCLRHVVVSPNVGDDEDLAGAGVLAQGLPHPHHHVGVVVRDPAVTVLGSVHAAGSA